MSRHDVRPRASEDADEDETEVAVLPDLAALHVMATAEPEPAADVAPVVRLDDVHLTFQRAGRAVPALRGVSLELRPGEIFGLVGESGSGKSVLGMSVLGLLPAAVEVRGEVEVCGADMRTISPGQLRRLRTESLGAVFQDPMTSLNPTMRVGRQMVEACGSKQEAVRLLDAAGVPDPARRLRSYPHELSGGLRQRVMIAMAIAGKPKLVVADEPTTALDVTVQAQILSLLRNLCDELGTAFLLITHDLGVAAQISDRIGVLYGGRLAEVGPAADALERPMHPYTAGLLRSRLTLETDTFEPIRTLRGEPPIPESQPPGCPFGPRCDHRTDECEALLPPLVALTGTDDRATACLRIGAIGDLVAAEGPVAVGVASVRERPTFAGRPAALNLVGVHKHFGGGRHGLRRAAGAHVLRGIDLLVREGEAVALVGESGCGKSTLLRIVAGLAGADGGAVEVGQGARPQMVFQDAGASLTPWLTVGEQIGERLRSEGLSKLQRRARVNDALRLAGLSEDVAAAKAHQLSGGQRQRVGLARAIVVPPEILLCDEPTSALDVSLAATVLNLIGRLRREFDMAVLFVTHDLAAARLVGDRIAVMYLGRIVEDGAAADVVERPAHPYTRALLSAVPEAGVRSVPLKGEPASPHHPPGGCAFHPRCPEALPRCATDEPPFEPSPAFGRPVACWLVPGPDRPPDAAVD
ncbi:MAG: oligopeptide/dipeptide transporter, ATPase subunit [Acidimicrobiales bacterium]|nr:oligopeptide/dipeptide transporter, ATPase subunit [Acidimicrobiales bacterium]